MGLAPADEVLPIRVFENATKLPFEDWNYSKFTATGSHVVRIEDIVKKYGPRVPAYGKAPTQFRGLVVVVVDRELSAAELDDLNQNLAGFSDPQPLNFGVSGHWEVMNFASATRGRSAMKLDGLLGLLKP